MSAPAVAHWVVRLPGFAYAGNPDCFMGKDKIVARLLAWTHDASYVELGVNSVTNPRRGAPEQGPTARGRVG